MIGSYHNIFRVGATLQDLGFWILNDVVWRKTNPMPNFRGRRFTNAHETLIWAAATRRRKGYTFNYEAHEGAQRRPADALRLAVPDLHRRRAAEGRRMATRLHPTQKPEALLHRVLLASTKPGDVVLDPFFGTGTTGAVAKRLGRHFIGIEREQAYIDAAAEARIAAVRPLDAPMLAALTAEARRAARCLRQPDRAPGCLLPGAMLYDARTRWAAKVRADGTLALGDGAGSIHQVGAEVQGLRRLQRLDLLAHERSGRLTPIDLLRQALGRGRTHPRGG